MKMPDWVTSDTLAKYKGVVNGIILVRLRVTIFLALVLHPAFYIMDRAQYPSYARTFFMIRLLNCLIVSIIFVLSFSKKIKRNIIWFADVMVLVVASGIIMMIHLSDGAMSHYYEGLNLCLLGFLIINGFYVRHNIVSSLVMLGLYALATITNPAGWDLKSFLSANAFMGSTAIIVVVMSKFYSTQHFNGFLSNEELKLSETKLARSNEKLEELYRNAEEMSKTDDLTKISNRRHFFEILKSKIAVSETTGLPFYLIIFDIDNFKQINDRYGHTFGDQVLLSVAQVVNNNIRPNSNLGRYGGDEFMMIFDKATKEEILKRVEGISYAIRGIPLSVENQQPLNVSASFGVVRYEPGRGVSETGLVEASDRELMKVKQARRGGISIGDS